MVSFLMNFFWVAGYFILQRLLKDVAIVQFRNLSGHGSFEMLMAYCQIVMVAGICLFCYAVTIMSELQIISH